MKPPTTVYVVDDDARLLKALGHLLQASKFTVLLFESPRLFLRHYDPKRPGCVICDLAMPGIDGLALHRKLKARGSQIPVIFLTGLGTIPKSVTAMLGGAANFLTKPVDERHLLAAIRVAIERDARHREVRTRIASLTKSERDLLACIAKGQVYKQIADDLGVTERTVKFHRANLARKLGTNSNVSMVLMGKDAGLDLPGRTLPPDSRR